MYRTAVYFLYREVFDRTPELSELVSLVRDLDPPEAAVLLCQLNADLRLPRRDKQAVAKVQQELAAYFLDDETIARFKQRFGPIDMADRPVFHPVQVLNVLRLVLQRSAGRFLRRTSTRRKSGRIPALVYFSKLFLRLLQIG
jgi:hypothetical protein